ncbi:MAG: type V CRISPR-associated protein Cas12b, partial [Terriglobales bacterium]
AQSRLARLDRWLWMLREPERRERAIKEIDAERPEWAHGEELAATLAAGRRRLTEALPGQLAAIANRCLPMRGRRWEWRPHPDAAGWRQLVPVGAPGPHRRLAGQRGISLERIAQIAMLRQRLQSLSRALQREPGAAPLAREQLRAPVPECCPEIPGKLDRLKRQRVNQTAHWVLAEALGVRPRPHAMPSADRTARDQHAEYERIPGRGPVDFIVLEDLSRYRSSRDRPPRENSRLNQWCHRQILAKVKELAGIFGIPVLETPAAYSSRFCSRSGAAGFRAVELTPDAAALVRWKKILADPEDDDYRATRQFFDWLRAANDGRAGKKPRCLIAPDRGGPLFVSLAQRAPGRAPEGQAPPRWVMQADINAAINLGLRAVAAPDVAEIHQRIRAKREGGVIQARAGSARERARWGAHPPQIRCDGEAASDYANFFVDVAGVAQFGHAAVTGVQARLASSKGLWTSVRQREWAVCREINRQRMSGWGAPLPAAGAASGF